MLFQSFGLGLFNVGLISSYAGPCPQADPGNYFDAGYVRITAAFMCPIIPSKFLSVPTLRRRMSVTDEMNGPRYKYISSPQIYCDRAEDIHNQPDRSIFRFPDIAGVLHTMYVDNTAVEVGHVFLLSVLDRRLILFILPRGTGSENIRSGSQ
jgi:hypothetical protein